MKQTLSNLLASFSGTTPLFPLPDFVFFPQTAQPFQIFEARYVEMVQDCQAGERMLTIPLLIESEGNGKTEAPPFRPIATLGYLSDLQEVEGGKFNILVTGLVKVQIEEVESEKPYRRGAVTPLTEFTQVTDEEHKRKSILRLFQSILEQAEVTSNFEILQGMDIPLQMLAHVIISALPIPAEEKQKMLELQSLDLRIEILLNFMESGLHTLDTLGPLESLVPTQPWWN
ncbi:MAG: LON peptidase substrate-binding domain-containing protein [Fidelibacterota bacterium]|nr:MAG: LON peptidase substrate-binding domain-containing protein [Candidatus Neomarinimicrobiota bacterium]